MYKKLHQKLLKLPMSWGNAAGKPSHALPGLISFRLALDFSAVIFYNAFVAS